MEVLFERYRRLLSGIKYHFTRSLSQKINWEARAICIEGARGVGKSTLMLQYIKQNLPIDQTLYVTLDDLYFRQHSIVDVAETFYSLGGRHLFMDEVHKYIDWQTAVKNMYDLLPELKIVVSGSSILALQRSKADLSRRMLHYHLPELSLREYIALKENIVVQPVDLERLLEHHTTIADTSRNSLGTPLKFFQDYLTYGAYPFFLEGENEYLSRINELINVIIDYDLPEAKPIEVATQARLKKLLYIISTAVPFQPNVSRLAEQTGVSRTMLLEMLHLLHEAQLINNLRSDTFGISLMNKPEKVYLHNTSQIMALAEGMPDKGNLRETFFLSQLKGAGKSARYPDTGDFMIDNKFLFEIGGKTKKQKQILGLENAFLALDDIESGYANKIPLWLFGFLY